MFRNGEINDLPIPDVWEGEQLIISSIYIVLFRQITRRDIIIIYIIHSKKTGLREVKQEVSQNVWGQSSKN